jgi:hypothetical protein
MTATTDYRTAAATSYTAAAESFDRCDTDGFVSQWAHNLTGDENRLKAELAENGGKTVTTALFLLDGRIASTHSAQGDYGTYWVLNDVAAAVVGKRFVSTSNAAKAKTRKANNAKKGITVGSVSVDGYATIVGSGKGLSGALSCRAVVRPSVDALKAGDYTIVATDDDNEDWN